MCGVFWCWPQTEIYFWVVWTRHKEQESLCLQHFSPDSPSPPPRRGGPANWLFHGNPLSMKAFMGINDGFSWILSLLKRNPSWFASEFLSKASSTFPVSGHILAFRQFWLDAAGKQNWNYAVAALVCGKLSEAPFTSADYFESHLSGLFMLNVVEWSHSAPERRCTTCWWTLALWLSKEHIL